MPSDLRKQGFADGKREIIRTHPPCTCRIAQSWAYKEFFSFKAQVASFKHKQCREITPQLRKEHQKLTRLGQTEVDAGLAAEALFDETLDSLLKARGMGPADGYRDYW